MNKIEFFLTNPEFVRWVKEPDKELDEYWGRWMKANPETFQDILVAKEIISSLQFEELKPEEGVKEEILSRILKDKEIADKKGKSIKNMPTSQKDGLWSRFGQIPRIAAILLLSLSISFYFMFLSPQKEKKVEAEVIPTLVKNIAKGEKLSFTLPDGTRVWLNSGSTIAYPEKFGTDKRQVKMEGEAFFEIEKDSLRPFQIVANGFVTTALGTSFNLKAKVTSGLQVSLFTGKVKVEEGISKEEFLLEPGLEFLDDYKSGKRTVRKFNADNVLAWKEGKIIFQNAGLSEVVATLEDWYGVEIKLVNSEKVAWKFSGEYQNQILDNVLNSMAFIEKFKYKINGKNVELIF
jgi:transmembrane sensor